MGATPPHEARPVRYASAASNDSVRVYLTVHAADNSSSRYPCWIDLKWKPTWCTDYLRSASSGRSSHRQRRPRASMMKTCRFERDLLERRIGLCGDATRAPTGACKQQKGRVGFYRACPAPSLPSAGAGEKRKIQ